MSHTESVSSSRSFLRHAKIIGVFTLLSRLLGLVREMVAGHYLGTGMVASAFTVAFTIPNLFRKLLGEGALSQAFIPLYAQAVERGRTETGDDPGRFAARSVKLLLILLILITLVGEVVLGLSLLYTVESDRRLMLWFTVIMLPYVMLVCGGAFLSGILQVHKRFSVPAFAPVLLNLVHIGVVILGAWFLGLRGRDEISPVVIQQQTSLAFYLAWGVLLAGVLQVLILWPVLKEVGFRFSISLKTWTPDTQKMLRLSLPVALGAAVLQTSVLLDKAISYGLMQGGDRATGVVTHFELFGETYRYPMELGATRRLELAQLMYQFPLGVFAIALATALFPSLSAGAVDTNRQRFKELTRKGVETTLWEGLPASVGLILIADPAVRLLFQHGQVTEQDASLIVISTRFYAAGIWSYALLHVINRAYYALQDAKTPLYASILNILVNLSVELPLVWVMGESGMAVGTLVSFCLQASIMLWILDRRVGGIGFAPTGKKILKMLIATTLMLGACLAVRFFSIYPTGQTRWDWAGQIVLTICIGTSVYFISSYALGLGPARRS
jgi:putative peptidoglycan lipid II flippase